MPILETDLNYPQSSLELFTQDLGIAERLTEAEERMLWQQVKDSRSEMDRPDQVKPDDPIIQAGTLARHRITLANMPLVKSIAGKYKGRGIEYEDLLSEGELGLLSAVDHFNPDLKLKFSTYAYPCIANRIGRALQAANKGRLQGIFVVSLNQPIGEEGFTIGDLIPDSTDSVEVQVERAALKEAVRQEVTMLPKIGRETLDMQYGLGESDDKDQDVLTNQLVADRFKVSPQAVQQRRDKAFEKMRRSSRLRHWK